MSSKKKPNRRPKQSVSQNPPADLWQKLALLRDREFCRADWQRHLGDGFAPLADYLELLPATVSATYPDPDTGLPLILRKIHDGTFTARPENPDETSATDITGLTSAQVARWKILWDKIGEAVAGAFDIEPHASSGPFDTPWVRAIGTCREDSTIRTALLLIATDDKEALSWIRHLRRGTLYFFILPFHDQVCADLALSYPQQYAALDRDLRFVLSARRWHLKARKSSAPSAPATSGPVWAKHAITEVDVMGDCNKIVFPDQTEIDFRGKAKRRAFLHYAMKRCVAENKFTFEYETFRQDYNELNPKKPIGSETLDHDLFQNMEGFERTFETLDKAKQHFRLLIRPG